MHHTTKHEGGVTGIALSATLGLGVGLIGGMLLRAFLTNIGTQPLKTAVCSLRKAETDETVDPGELEQAVSAALEEDPDTRALGIGVEALGDGIVELTGSAPDPLSRQIAGDITRSVPGADIVVNRILVKGGDGGAGSESQPATA